MLESSWERLLRLEGSVVKKICLLASLALAALVAPTFAWAETATVTSGTKSQITTHMRFDNQCNAIPVVIEILAKPANGTVTTESKDIVVRAATPRGGEQPSKCVGKTVGGVAIFYQSKAGFTGQDSFRYRRTSESRGDRSSGEISYTVTVK
jgi:hypothetical protein